MDEKQPVAEALRSEILKLASDGAITPEVLLRIMRVAKTGRDLLVSLNASPTSLAAMLKRPRSPFGIPVLGENMQDDGVGLEDGPSANYLPYAPSSPNENFGMAALRELIAAGKNLTNGLSAPRLVEAIAIARDKGLHDVARDLERQLGIANGKPLEGQSADKKEIQA